MDPTPSLTFKIASEEWEFEQIYRLNYQTFVEEIPQHQGNPTNHLVDRFDKENTYLICLEGRRLVGMMALRGQRPFSLDEKLPDLDSYLPPGRSVCEIRLLAVDPSRRYGPVFLGLAKLLFRYGTSQGYDLAVISGILKQQKLYRRLGFVPFGPIVGTGEARFQPMYLTLEAFQQQAKVLRVFSAEASTLARVNLLPGPVSVRPEVRQAFNTDPISHRGETFLADFQETKRRLCRLVNARRVEILLGSGSLANDAIAAQLSLQRGRGLILSNGEFGNRLLDHASRLGLSFEGLLADWGQPFERDAITQMLDRHPDIAWLWAVHCETSTGVLNDLAMLKEICAARSLRLCLDGISSIGTVSVDLQGVYLASGVSGKGLGAFPGLAMVFYHHEIAPAKSLPRYLDLGLYAATNGVPFTHSSNLLHALRAALDRFTERPPFTELAETSAWLRSRLRAAGFHLVAPDAHASPAVITIALPKEIHSESLGRRLEQAGYLLSYKSDYLLQRNWVQICLMGEYPRDALVPLLEMLQGFSYSDRCAS